MSSSPVAHAHRKLPVCPNCGTDLADEPNFCPTCGQENHDLNISFGHVVEETLEGVFHFDSKVWRTFRELITRPGLLTRHFVEGKRASYVPPIRLYVFISLVFFFLLGKRAASENEEGNRPLVELKAPTSASPVKVDQKPSDNSKAPASTDAGLADSLTAYQPAGVDEILQMLQDSLAAENKARKDPLEADGGGLSFDFDSAGGALKARGNVDVQTLVFDGALLAKDIKNKALMERLAKGEQPFTDSLIRARGGEPSFVKRMGFRQAARLKSGPEALLHQLVKSLSAGMFILMPLFALLMKVFYRRQRPLYVQHLMFSIHLHCFFFLFFSFLLLLAYVLPAAWEIPIGIPVVVTWAYWVLALRRFSEQSLKRSLWKGSLLFTGYVGVLLLFTLGILLISLMTF
jgi:hypothetical protein